MSKKAVLTALLAVTILQPASAFVYSNWDEMEQRMRHMQEEMNDLYRKVFATPTLGAGLRSTMETNEVEVLPEHNQTIVRVKLAGFDKSNVHVDVEKTKNSKVLIIKAEQEVKSEGTDEGTMQKYQSASTFAYRYGLNDYHDEKKVHATYKDGLLTVTIPHHEKKEPKKKTMSIAIF